MLLSRFLCYYFEFSVEYSMISGGNIRVIQFIGCILPKNGCR
jgi:hypothetical protein